MLEFSGKVAVVIGGASGIGRAAARLLTDRGANVISVGRDERKGTHAVSELPRAKFIRADITQEGDVDALIATLERDHADVALLVNAAGVFIPKPFLDHARADYDKYLDINRGTFFVTQAIARGMVKRGSGAIVNIGSMWAKQAIKATPSSAYSMAKAGLHALTQHLAMELSGYGIRVNAVSPAVVATPVYEAFIPKEQIPRALAGFDGFHPLGRVGTSEDIAEAGWPAETEGNCSADAQAYARRSPSGQASQLMLRDESEYFRRAAGLFGSSWATTIDIQGGDALAAN
jgi:NAD(P)-dependent dehydrogenase (short-subunit alcohol dehydrogenase family)